MYMLCSAKMLALCTHFIFSFLRHRRGYKINHLRIYALFFAGLGTPWGLEGTTLVSASEVVLGIRRVSIHIRGGAHGLCIWILGR